MKHAASVAFAVWGLALSSAARADSPQFEASGFVGIDYFGSDTELGNSWAAEQIPGTAALLGARLGWIVIPDLAPNESIRPQIAVEAELRFAAAFTGGVVSGQGRGAYFSPVFGWRSHMLFRLAALGGLSPHFVLGAGGETVASTSPFMEDDTDFAGYYGLGATWKASRRWSVRIDGRHALMAGRMDTVTSTFAVQLGIGTSWSWDPVVRAPVVRAPALPPSLPPPQPQDSPSQATEKPVDPDTDADTIADSQDRCPLEVEDTDGHEDADGCPDPDNDSDGVSDADDRCPRDAETRNGFADNDGCPDVMPPALAALEGPLRGVSFVGAKAKLAPASAAVLASAAAVLRQHAEAKVVVTGIHKGPVAAGDLGVRRAEAVKWALVDHGVAADRITTNSEVGAGGGVTLRIVTP